MKIFKSKNGQKYIYVKPGKPSKNEAAASGEPSKNETAVSGERESQNW